MRRKLIIRELLLTEMSRKNVSIEELADMLELSVVHITNYLYKGEVPKYWTIILSACYDIELDSYSAETNKPYDKTLRPIVRKKLTKALREQGVSLTKLADDMERSPDTVNKYLTRGSLPPKWLDWIESKYQITYETYSS